jgi:zinc protease
MPDKYLMEIDLPDMNMTAVKLTVNGDSIKLAQMGQSPELDENARKEIKSEAAIFPELNFSTNGSKLELTSIKNLDGKDAYEIKVTAPSGDLSTYYYDVATGYKLRVIKEGKQGTSTVDFGDYRDVNGIKFPYHTNNDQGQVVFDLTVDSIKVNGGLPDTDFK